MQAVIFNYAIISLCIYFERLLGPVTLGFIKAKVLDQNHFTMRKLNFGGLRHVHLCY